MRALIGRELKELTGRKGFYVIGAVILLCVLAGLLAGGIQGAANKPAAQPQIKIGIVDQDGSYLSGVLVNYFADDPNFSRFAEIETMEEKQTEQRLADGSLTACLVIPEHFVDNLITIDNSPIFIRISTKNTTNAILLKNVFESYEKYIAAVQINCMALYDQMEADGMEPSLIEQTNREISMDLVFTALGRDGFFEFIEEPDFKSTPIKEYYFYVLEAMLLLSAGIFTGLLFLKEKNSMVFARGVAAGLHGWQYALSKGLVYGSVTGAAAVLVNRSAGRLLDIPFQLKNDGIIVCFVIFSILLGMLPSLLVKNEKTYMIAGNMFHFITCIAGGAIVPFMYLPEILRNIAEFTPVYWFVRLMAA